MTAREALAWSNGTSCWDTAWYGDSTRERTNNEADHHVQAVTDFPAACFGPELISAYPEAKVILTTRDPDAWVESVRSTLNWRYNDKVLYWLSFVDWGYRMYAPLLAQSWKKNCCYDHFHSLLIEIFPPRISDPGGLPSFTFRASPSILSLVE
jgi:hypothetical protein